MKLRNLILFVFLALTACKSPLTVFNHVPKNYYTRHHTQEVKVQEREPIACLAQSEDRDDQKEETVQDFSVSRNNDIPETTLRPIYKDFGEPNSLSTKLSIDTVKQKAELEPETEPLGVLSSASAIAFWAMVYVNIAYYATVASVLALPALLALSLVLGFVSIFKIKNNKEKYNGRGFGYFGILAGIIPALLLILSIILILATW